MQIVLALLVVGGLVLWWRVRLRAEYARDVSARLEAQSRAGAIAPSAGSEASLLTERDLSHLPAVLQRYIQRSGAVGRPLVRNVRAELRGRIRGGPDEPWMPFEAEQHNFFDHPARFFYLHARKSGVPVQVYHRYVDASATMRVRAAWLVPLVNAAGPEMDESETVTMLNDMCWLVPGTLISDRIQWDVLDSRRVVATFTNAGHTVRATLVFNAEDELVDFVSDDRSAASADGRSFTRMRWSTPMHHYRAFGVHRASARGEGLWHATTGEYSYIEVELVALDVNVAPP